MSNPYTMAMNLPCEICGLTTHPVDEHSGTGLLICGHPDCRAMAHDWHEEQMRKLDED